MSINKSKGNMYEWIDETWNPLAGECPHKCGYCSTNKLMRYPVIKNKYSGEIRIDEKALNKNLSKGKTWFVVGQNDLFANNVCPLMIQRILWQCHKYDNQYLYQTKNPERILRWIDSIPQKSIICTTIETNRIYKDCDAPSSSDRAKAMSQISFKKYVTIEPIMDFDLKKMVELIKQCNPIMVNIGANSFDKIKLPEPSKEKVLELISELQKFTTIHNKSNLERILK